MKNAIAALCLLAWASSLAAPGGAEAASVTFVVRDAGTGDTLAVRASVTDEAGTPRYPPIGHCLYQPVAPGYFYADGPFTVQVPAGSAVARFSHGFLYEDRVLDLPVSADTTVDVLLAQVVEMPPGWRSGDTHVHLAHDGGYYTLHPQHGRMIAAAEGLDVMFCLDNEWDFTGAPDPCSTDDCVVWMSEERRSASTGDLAMLGIGELVLPTWSAWCPTTAAAADTAHARWPGAVVVAVHPVTTTDFFDVNGWPGVGTARAAPLHALGGQIDAIEIMSYSNCDDDLARDLWYRLLNCGFHLPAVGATDACPNRLGSRPAGGFRTWVRSGEGAVDATAWLDGLGRGRSFVSSGPLIPEFAVFDASMGDSLYLCRGSWTVYGTISARSRRPIHTVEIVRNGEAAITWELPPGTCSIDTCFYLPVDESSWVAARVAGGGGDWLEPGAAGAAHTNPVWLPMVWERVVEHDAASGFVSWLDDLDSLARREGDWPAAADSAAFFAVLDAGRDRFHALAATATAVEPPAAAGPPPALVLRQNVPNPFTGSTLVSFGRDPGGLAAGGRVRPTPVEIAVYDVAGRLVRRLWRGSIGQTEAGVVWDGTDGDGRSVASGVYFCRLRAPGVDLRRKMVLVR